MKISNSVKNSVSKRTPKGRRLNGRTLMTSYVSLFLIIMLLVGTTAAWFVVYDTATVVPGTFTLESASGLRVNEGEAISNHIRLNDIKLSEASSVDGRNLFFPTKGTLTDKTESMFYREGTVGDKNVKYVHKDFTLKGSVGITDVYVKSYDIKLTDDAGAVLEEFSGSTGIIYDANGKPTAQEVHQDCPVRIAFITESSATPQVIDPTALVDNYVQHYNAVDTADDNGYPVTLESTAFSFSDYYYLTGTPMFTLYENDPINVSMVVWLEGGENTKDGVSNSSRYAGCHISVDVELESNWADNEAVYFVDDTIGASSSPQTGNIETPHWITTSYNKGESLILMSYTDEIGDTRTVVMQKASFTFTSNNGGNNGACSAWYASIPKDVVSNISFFRYSITDETIYNAWHTKAGVNAELASSGTAWIDAYYKRSLDESRNLADGTHSIVYTALRDNGNGDVDDSLTNYMELRLAPGVGYWDWTGPADQTATTATSATTATTATTATSSTISGTKDKFSITLALREDDKWVQNLLADSSAGYKLYVEMDDGVKYELNATSDPNRYILDNVYGSRGSSFKRFYLYNGYNYNYLELDKAYPLNPSGETGFTYNFTMQTNNKVKLS